MADQTDAEIAAAALQTENIRKALEVEQAEADRKALQAELDRRGK